MYGLAGLVLAVVYNREVCYPLICSQYISTVLYVDWDATSGIICFNILSYADDILLLAPSVSALQSLLNVCEQGLLQLDMAVNVRKSSCTRIGARFNAKCCCYHSKWCGTSTDRHCQTPGRVYRGSSQVLLLTPQCQKIILSGLHCILAK